MYKIVLDNTDEISAVCTSFEGFIANCDMGRTDDRGKKSNYLHKTY